MKRPSIVKVGKPYGTSGGGGGGAEYTQGYGINISNNEISADTQVLAEKSDIAGKQDILTPAAPMSITQVTESATHNVPIAAGRAVLGYHSSVGCFDQSSGIMFRGTDISRVPTSFNDTYSSTAYIKVPVNLSNLGENIGELYIRDISNTNLYAAGTNRLLITFGVNDGTDFYPKFSLDEYEHLFLTSGSIVETGSNVVYYNKVGSYNGSEQTYTSTGTEQFTKVSVYSDTSIHFKMEDVWLNNAGVMFGRIITYASIPLTYLETLQQVNEIRIISKGNDNNFSCSTDTSWTLGSTVWTLANSITTYNRLAVGYDNSTIKVNGSNQLYVNGKQDTLVSGTNIKTINDQSILGSGNIEIQGGGGSITPGKGLKYAGGHVPYLTANGTVGGDNPATTSSGSEGGSYPEWKAFSTDQEGYWGPSGGNYPNYLTYYSPTPIRLAQVTYKFKNTGERMAAGTIYGSNDNSTWEELGSFSGNTQLNVSVEITATEKYKYIKHNFTSKTDSGYGKVHVDMIYANADEIEVDIDTDTILFDGNKVSAKTSAAGAGLKKELGNHTHVAYLSSVGTMGGATPACYCWGNNDAYKAYSSNASEFWGPGSWTEHETTYYSPVPITASKVVYRGGTLPYECTLLGSNDNSTWVVLGAYTNGTGREGTRTVYPTDANPYKYFKSHFVGDTGYGHSVHIDIYSGELVMNVLYDDNSIKTNSQGKLYAPIQEAFDIKEPLKYEVLEVGGMTNYTVSSGHLLPSYPYELGFQGVYNGVIMVYRNAMTPTSVAEIFQNTSYIDIPCDIDKKMAKIEKGELNSMNCLFSSFVTGEYAYQGANWIAGNWDGTTFTPILYAGAGGYMGASVSFTTGNFVSEDEWTYGLEVDTTATASGQTALGDGAHLAITYDGTNYKVETCGTEYGYTMSANTTSITTAQIAKLKQINVVRYVNSNGSSTAANNPTVDGFGYNNSAWTPADGPQEFKTLVFDPSTIAGYSAEDTQVLKHVAGVLTWVTE